MISVKIALYEKTCRFILFAVLLSKISKSFRVSSDVSVDHETLILRLTTHVCNFYAESYIKQAATDKKATKNSYCITKFTI